MAVCLIKNTPYCTWDRVRFPVTEIPSGTFPRLGTSSLVRKFRSSTKKTRNVLAQKPTRVLFIIFPTTVPGTSF